MGVVGSLAEGLSLDISANRTASMASAAFSQRFDVRNQGIDALAASVRMSQFGSMLQPSFSSRAVAALRSGVSKPSLILE